MEINATDLVAIIAACREAKVYSFKTGDVTIEFMRADEEIMNITAPQIYTDILANREAQVLTPDEVAERAEIEDANLLFEDPTAWEREQMKDEG